ncbi:zf-CGNR multi-domain protein [Mycetocola tolaasinivorans]|uniref:Zf-CGNR multi-domain protein n=1 Tax=Mycetocola tolaasinivorans TaxID=76635 RepID=A0A3L7A039_9MICO|nr:CGNR zinc finger domain-containing protein [Mycetocola tolaasinivorans]RLP73340.1 zf-CGNR multi-domain protein [Mycetocola tolaasinivorans]
MQKVSERYGVTRGPGDAGAVQDLLNTFSSGRITKPDVLADVDTARNWWESRGVEDPPVAAGTGDPARLRELRDALRRTLTEEAPETPSDVRPDFPRARGALTLSLAADGSVIAASAEDGWEGVVSQMLLHAYRAQQDGTWRRLKVCKNPTCGVAFYDRSRNMSGVWHDAQVCGNIANLRASRARKRAREDDRRDP